jgi:hypothetical protein
MTLEEFEDKMNTYELDDAYAEFIMERSSIGNGDSLIIAMERGDYFESFMDTMVDSVEV